MNASNLTIEAYNKNASNYADQFMNFNAYEEKVRRFQRHYISPNSNILDLGCGPGNNAKLLLDMDGSCRLTGFYLSHAMIQMAKETVPECQFMVQDIREIEPKMEYDTIIASFCMVHLTDDEMTDFIKNLSKMLKIEGSLYLSFMEGKKAGVETTSFSKDEMFFNYFNRNVIKNLLKAHTIETVELLTEEYQEPDGSVTQDIFIFARKQG